MLATASVTALVFFIIYVVVQTAVYQELDNDLAFEAHKHTQEIFIKGDSVIFKNKSEWAEEEHREVQVNPVFIQLVNGYGALMDKSPNLKEEFLLFQENKGFDIQFDTKLNNHAIRQIQVPIEKNGIHKGYILTAMSLEGAVIVLDSLKKNLLILFPMVLLGLFFITRFLAGKSIVPVKTITETADRITRNSLNERIPLPTNKDELFTLTSSINELLSRMQDALEREKQFTADASHQLRTPLAVLKGTLEVLVRKPRKEEEYQEKIKYSILEIDRISVVVDQLLVLARLDKNNAKISKTKVNLPITVNDVLARFKEAVLQRGLSIKVAQEGESTVVSDPYYVDLILENIISNAIKYADPNSTIDISIFPKNDKLICRVKDFGVVVNPAELEHIFNPFFRSDALAHKSIKGNGLGLSIAKKACDLLNVHIAAASDPIKGTVFSLSFPTL